MKLLHIYGQEAFHDEVYIVGNKEALTDLRNAIDMVLAECLSCRTGVSVNDGEGYDVIVVKDDNDWKNESWIKRAVPYTADYARETREDAFCLCPWEN